MKAYIGLALCLIAILTALVRLATIIFAFDFIFGISFILLLIGLVIAFFQKQAHENRKAKKGN